MFRVDFLISLSLEGGQHYSKVGIGYDKCHVAHQKNNFCKSYDVIGSRDTSIFGISMPFLFQTQIEITSNRIIRTHIIFKAHTLVNIYTSETSAIFNRICVKFSNN